MKKNGWIILAHECFLSQLEKLTNNVEQLKKAKPETYKSAAPTKTLAAIRHLVFDIIPSDPGRAIYRQGKTLGKAHTHWRRAKFGNGRFRLFFRYDSKSKIIIYAWVNDTDTLRTYKSKTDAYAVFKKMLRKGNPPDNWDVLRQAALKSTKGLGNLFRKIK